MTDCYCDYDAPSVLHRRDVKKSRRQTKCSECGVGITAGSEYEYVFGVWDGDAVTVHTCSHCRDIRKFMLNSLPCFCYEYGNLTQNVRDALEDAYDRAGSEVAGLAFGVGRLMVAQRRAKEDQSIATSLRVGK